jgi:hypothetical protein
MDIYGNGRVILGSLDVGMYVGVYLISTNPVSSSTEISPKRSISGRMGTSGRMRLLDKVRFMVQRCSPT